MEIKHGGKRSNAGRKNLYGEITVTKSFRMPASKELEICKKIGTILKIYQIKNKVKK